MSGVLYALYHHGVNPTSYRVISVSSEHLLGTDRRMLNIQKRIFIPQEA